MNAERLLAHYERIADAPDAIARLRPFILELAVRGKLVPQDPKDEPASELLKRIAAEKARLVKAGEIRKEKPSVQIRDDEHPISLPKNWAWLRLHEIGVLSGGMTPSMNRPDFWDGDIVWLSPKDIKADEVTDSELKITAKGLSETRLETYRPGSLFMVARSGILKRVFPVSINRVPAAANQDMKVLVPFLDGQERYLQIMFRGLTDFILRDLVKTGTTVQSLKYAEFEEQPFPLPPLAEQYRIVAKVDELMALCDRLEAARAEREATRDWLAAASLARLNAPDPDTFQDDARFALDVLPALTMRPDQIKQLRRTILNLAVRGKLVPQDPMNEALAKRYGGEPSSNDLPANWCMLNFGKHCDIEGGNQPPKSQFISEPREGYVQLLQIRDLGERPVPTYIPVGSTNRFCKEGEILIGRYGASVGKVFWAKNGAYNVAMAKFIWPEDAFTSTFAFLLLKSEYLQGPLASATRSAQAGFNKSDLAAINFPLPPLAEQHRIVAKVDELMVRCDRLEENLTTGENIRRRLLDALLYEALTPGDGLVMEQPEKVAAHG